MQQAYAVATQPVRVKPILSGATERAVSLSYLRAFITILVVAHHSAIVYMTMKPPHWTSWTAQPRFWLVFPVSDPAGFVGFDLFVGWNDIFFMPLMFLVSGVFIWPSLQRRGTSEFLKSRFMRLGIPFAATALLLGPFMYLPAYLQRAAHPSAAEYARIWLSLGNWPSGPTWFIWVLLLFNCVAAACFARMPRAVETAGKWCAAAARHPVRFFLAVVALTELVYLPLFFAVGPYGAIMFGPFFVQGTKLLVYILYFFIGVCAGIAGPQSGVFSPGGKLARRWWAWGVASLLFFAAWIAAYATGKDLGAAPVFPFSCAATGMFMIALFARFARRNRVADHFSDNAYGVYLLHYALLGYVQLALVALAVPALVKGTIALGVALAASWALVALLRKIPAVARVI